ncbi:dihydrofolate reductase family protein [Brachybacterium sp. EF45031]|uniref:dihydrofolate reductase family protein n=1 Tax=Brachybacterium sillae TaxID=2810536 RepID=UPI00217D0D17|nr:dihydrofolate reductase family protein [Brachybacterium sillae]MCS6712709.1 dihydrofolate reductase family protein [Brachybacterium sillae]
MHVLWRDARPVPSPVSVTPDDAGAVALAELYALPSDRVTVRAMMNTTVDGAIAGADGTSGSLHNPDDSFAFGVLRALIDVVVVGAGTVRAEEYRRPLGRRSLREGTSLRPGGRDHPALAVLSRSGNLPEVVRADWPTFLVTGRDSAREATAASGLPTDQVIVADTPEEILRGLTDRGHRGIQIEGGPSTLAAFVAAGLVDELCFSVSHRTVGGPSPRVLDGPLHEQDWALQSLIVGDHATLTRYRRI